MSNTLQHNIDALTRAIANGEKSVRFADGRWVDYQTPSELIKAREYLLGVQRSLRAAGRRRQVLRTVPTNFSGRGYQ